MMKENKIAIILPRGETIRNFVYSDIVKALKEKFEITLLAVKPNEEIWNLLKKQSDELIEIKKEKFSYKYRLFFEIYDLAHNRYMWSEAAKVRWEMRDVEATSFKQKAIRIFKKGIARILANQTALVFLEKIELYLASKEKQVKEYREVLKNKEISLVFNTSHSHAKNAFPIIYAANLEKLKTCTFLFSWDNLTSQGRVVPRYNYYFSWNSKIKEDFIRIYPHINKNQIIVTGTPQFVNHFEENKYISKEKLYERLGLNENDKYFLYSSGMSHHMPYEPYVVERIAGIIYSIDPKLKLVVRTYAKDKHSVFEDLKNKREDIIIPEVDWEPNFQTPLAGDQAFYVALLKNCIAGINVASTISLELCMLNKPAINVGYNPPEKNIYPYNYTRFYSFDHYKPIVGSRAVQVAKDENEMQFYLNEAIVNPEKYKDKRKQLVSSFFEDKIGRDVIENFVSSIEKIVNS